MTRERLACGMLIVGAGLLLVPFAGLVGYAIFIAFGHSAVEGAMLTAFILAMALMVGGMMLAFPDYDYGPVTREDDT